jgi:DNA-binding PucR family transcriptional regulator
MVAADESFASIASPNVVVMSHNVLMSHDLRTNAETGPLAALIGRIDRDEFAETLLRTFRAEIPGYARLPDSVVRGRVLGVIRQNLDLCLDWVAGGGAPDAARLEEFSASAKNRATEGMPLEDLLRAYRMGGTATWRLLCADATADQRDALPQAAEMVMSYLDTVSGIVAAAYLEEREHLVSEQERAVRVLLDALLAGEPLDAPHLETAARLGFTLGRSFATFAVAIPGEGARTHARAAAGLRTAGTLALTEGDRVVGLCVPGRDPARALPAGAVAVVDADVTRTEVAASLADVRLGIEIAVRSGRAGVVPLQSLTLDLLLARAPRVAADLRKRVVEPLGSGNGRSGGDLLQTVATYVELSRDRRRTAERLYIHPNTLDHRLRRARELTGLNLDDPEDLATMVLALHEAR